MRGNHSRGSGGAATAGSIPARAGEPQPVVSVILRPGVYPRACGGTEDGEEKAARNRGLSPRVRGNPPGARERRGHQRSIPARAGEPHASLPRPGRYRVYPRACGGTPNPTDPLDVGLGLSPRVRGNRAREAARHPVYGSIPARAGEPSCRRPMVRTLRVYPRACGGTFTWLPIP